MRGTEKLLAILVLFAIFAALGFGADGASQATSAVEPADYGDTITLADRRIQESMERYHLPSTVVALVDDQDTVWQQGFGLASLECEEPAQVGTVYKLWSIAKLFTAIETMRLVEEGLIDLDAPVSAYLPEFGIQSRFSESHTITVRSILAHRSGLPRNPCHVIEHTPGDPAALQAMAQSVVDCQAVGPVGTRYHYSNLGPNILGAIIQKVRGESFQVHMRDGLLQPLGMTNSSFISSDIAPGHDPAMGYEFYKKEFYPIGQGDIKTLASGNLYSTLEDMAIFAKFVFRDGEVKGRSLIRPETLRAMYQEQYAGTDDPQPMGLGWKVARVLGDELLVWHDGGPAEGVGSLIALLPDRKLGVILFANGLSFESSLSLPLALELLAGMLEAKYGVGETDTPTRDQVRVEKDTLSSYVGRYVVFGDVMKVTLRGSRLKAKYYGLGMTLVPMGDGTFRMDHWLLDLGLCDLLRLPMDLRDLRIEFVAAAPGAAVPGAEEHGEPVMFINFEGIFHERCPKYPDIVKEEVLWQGWIGEYDLSGRLPGGHVTNDVFGHDEIVMDDGILNMPGVVGPLVPLDQRMAVIQSGPFAGEVVERQPAGGTMYHQWVVYTPAAS